MPYTELVNPVLTPLSDELEDGWEGCLSVPGLRGVVPRYTRLRYEGFDPHGRPIRRDVTGFHARVVQHECDHLLGILYPMRMRDFRAVRLSPTSCFRTPPARSRIRAFPRAREPSVLSTDATRFPPARE